MWCLLDFSVFSCPVSTVTVSGFFGPVDRIGQLTMRNLDIADSRSKLEIYASQDQLSGGYLEIMGELEAGGGAQIAANPAAANIDDEDDALDRAAMEFGTD